MPHKEKLKGQEKIELIRRCRTGELGKTKASRDFHRKQELTQMLFIKKT